MCAAASHFIIVKAFAHDAYPGLQQREKSLLLPLRKSFVEYILNGFYSTRSYCQSAGDYH
jgi:hypothetical protein